MTRRGRAICLILPAIITVILEVLTKNLMNYNPIFRIVSSFTYYCNIFFIVVTRYSISKDGPSQYYNFALKRDFSILGLQMVVYYLFGNSKGIPILALFIIIVLVVTFSNLAIKFAKLAEKHSEFVFFEE